jgi:hypothetical protein
MTTTRRILQATAGNASALDISTLFSTDLYTGTGSDITITNGVDLAGEGGLVWIKARDDNANHGLYDTERGARKIIRSDTTAAEQTVSAGREVYQFNSDGYIVGNEFNNNVNRSGNTYASWTFRKSPNFFDVVTYTGNGTAGRTVSHNLGVVPGMIIVKRTDAAGAWETYHRVLGGTKYLVLNTTAAEGTAANFWNNTDATSTDFTLGTWSGVNASGGSYVAYLFAHDTTDNGVIQCGSYTGNGSSSGPTITLGWEPQYILAKRSTGTPRSWIVLDSARGLGAGNDPELAPDASNQENATSGDRDWASVSSTGFQILSTNSTMNNSGDTYIYCAIRAEGV